MKCFSLILAIYACSVPNFSSAHARKINERVGTKLDHPKIISFENEFRAFLTQAKGKAFEKKVELWTLLVEKPHQEFFDSIVWVKKKDDDAFSTKRLKQLQVVFSRLERHETSIRKNLQMFESVLKSQIARYRKVFPDAEFPVNCYAAIGGNFLGRVDTTQVKKVLAFGIDKIADMGVNADVLYSHELFHVYQSTKSNVNDDERMIVQLWAEGLASFVSHELSPTVSLKDIFMYQSTAQIGDDQLPRLASLFLSVANKKDHPHYYEWFLSEKDSEKIPAMAGYWLGYKVAKALRAQHDLATMSVWSAEKAEQMATVALKQFAQSEPRKR